MQRYVIFTRIYLYNTIPKTEVVNKSTTFRNQLDQISINKAAEIINKLHILLTTSNSHHGNYEKRFPHSINCYASPLRVIQKVWSLKLYTSITKHFTLPKETYCTNTALCSFDSVPLKTFRLTHSYNMKPF